MPTSVIQGFFPHGLPRIQGATLPNAVQLPPQRTPAPAHGGQPLPAQVRQRMETFFGAAFGDVRVHLDGAATSIGALAFTHGSHIHFAPGQYNPSTARGVELLAHELAHVVQQKSGRVRNPFGNGTAVVHDRTLEAEADRAVQRLTATNRAEVAQRTVAPPPRPALPAVQQGPSGVVQGAFRGGLPGVIQCCRRGGIEPMTRGTALHLPPSLLQLSTHGGSPIQRGLRRWMEGVFSTSFDDVRVHVGREIAPLNATALTHGSHIYFAAGTYNPATPAGRRMLAHELAHVVQQRSARVRNPFGSGIALVQDRALDAEAQRMSMRASAAEIVQRTSLAQIRTEQARIHAGLKNDQTKANFAGRYTTVGFEFDFVETEKGNPLEGIAHLEFAKSQEKQFALPYLLETDAGNVIELVTPPFLVETVKAGTPVPSKAGVKEIIEAVHGELKQIKDIKTLGELVASNHWQTGFGIHWDLPEGNIGVQPRNWSWRTSGTGHKNLTMDDLLAIGIKIDPKVMPQINIATSAVAYDWAYDEKGSRVPKQKAVKELNTLTSRLTNAMTDWQPQTPAGIMFKTQFIRVLAQQIVVPAIKRLAQIQAKGFNSGTESLKQEELNEASVAADLASFIKDVSNIWLKDDVISYGLGIMTRDDWQAAAQALIDLMKKQGFKQSVTNLLDDADTVWPLMKGLIDSTITRILDEFVPEMTYDGRQQPLTGWLTLDERNWPKLHEHRTDIPGVRQDTFIRATALRNVTELLGFDNTRLHVIEVRDTQNALKLIGKLDSRFRQ